jgi:hypothetical protein
VITIRNSFILEPIMNAQERQVIDELFDRLREVEQREVPREPVAEAHICSRIEAQPNAPYYMAQAIIVQEQTLHYAQARIEELGRELASRPAGGGFLSNIFGGSQPQTGPQPHPDNMQGQPPGIVNRPSRRRRPWVLPAA